ncbi:MAG TPA: hypothetical protein VNR40_08175 [Steroidobacter sp.]|nr:hypothetical protein [Steroidobacter sp.]
MSSLFVAAATLLCLLAMTVFAATARLDGRYIAALIIGLGSGGVLDYLGLQAAPTGIAGVVIGAVGVHLWTRFGTLALSVGLGVLTAQLHELLALEGFDAVTAILAALFVLSALLWTVHKYPNLAPPALHLEAVLLVVVVAVFVGAAPAIVTGWHAATALNVSAAGAATATDSLSTVLLIPICLAPLLLGALYSLWGRRRRC